MSKTYKVVVSVVEVTKDGPRESSKVVESDRVVKVFPDEERAMDFVSYSERTTFGGEVES
jgi:hypothetical protein